MEKAGHLAETMGVQDFKASVGRLERWKERNNIKLKKQHGKKQDTERLQCQAMGHNHPAGLQAMQRLQRR